MPSVTLQIHRDGWRDVATFVVDDATRGAESKCSLVYDDDFVIDLMVDERPEILAGVALAYPPEFGLHQRSRWPAFLDDIRPAGAARRWWTQRLGTDPDRTADFALLSQGTAAPVGNLRVREALPEEREDPVTFPVQAVVDRDHEFLEHAAASGAAIGGATGAGGEAPKLLLQRDGDTVWIDTCQEAAATAGEAFLVKFPRGDRSDLDRDILRAEAVYQAALGRLGFNAVDVSVGIVEGAREPSLWMRRFDRPGAELLGLESLYSLIDAAPGSWQNHETYLDALVEVYSGLDQDPVPMVVEYLVRDLLNVVFGNSDNHGRNTALLKSDTAAWLAPIYDFAPMKLDPEGVLRTSRWRHHEQGSRIDWLALARDLPAPTDMLEEALRDTARRLRDLPDLLAELGLPSAVLEARQLGLGQTNRKLKDWGLL